MKLRYLSAAAAAFLVAACSQSDKDSATAPDHPAQSGSQPAPGAASDVAASSAGVSALGDQPKSFAQCAVCHGTEAGKKGIGPTLAGVFGAKAGHVGDYAYSPAMRESGLTWDEAALDNYLTSPQSAVPGTKMSFGGMGDAQKRAEIIAYLKTL